MQPWLFFTSLQLALFMSANGLTLSRSITDILGYYETLDRHDIAHNIVKRSLDSSDERHLNFHSHKKDFHLKLIPSQGIFAPQFEAVTVNGAGKEEHNIIVNQQDYYKGYLTDDISSHAVAHIEDKLITATITTDNDTYIIEPMGRHVIENDTQHPDMIIYKITDMKWNLTHSNSSQKFKTNPGHCEVNNTKKYFVEGDENFESFAKEFDDTYHTSQNHSRKRRAIVRSKNMCNIVLVCDYLLYEKLGKSAAGAVNYMLQVATVVNEIYMQTDWTDLGMGIGIQVKKVVVHNAFSDSNGVGYNRPPPDSSASWNVDRLLTEFSRHNWSEYCLAHLFTYQDFDRGVIGLAYVATPSNYEVGGICTKLYHDVVGRRYLNCGLSSGMNWGRPLLTREAQLVTAHELGHNFGSNHDPSSCNSNTNGKYIMYATSVAGDKKNNDKFSLCSRKSISAVLKLKRAKCFSEFEKAFCGNNKVEDGEDCDPGLGTEDKCCYKCRFRPSAQCSDSNSACCENCSFAQSSKTCRGEYQIGCLKETKCSGLSDDCPKAPIMQNGEACGFGKGNCVNGVNCSTKCEQAKKLSCTCSAGGDSCKVCCQDNKSSPCLPLLTLPNKQTIDENSGIPCFLSSSEQGYCINSKEGLKCEKQQQNVKDEFSDLLNDFTFSNFARFMEANIVGTILVFSLLIWIPASCVVHYSDHKQNMEHEEMKNWLNPTNKQLLQKGTPAKRLRMLFQRSNVKEQTLPRTQYHISS